MRPLLRRLLRSMRAGRAGPAGSAGLVAPGDRVALAVSGGADSVALAWLMHELVAAGDLPIVIAGLVHLNHGLRGEESDRDEAFVRALGDRLGVSVDVGRADVGRAARDVRRSIESVAREARDAFFAESARRLDATSLATAHTADDQAETVLLRLLRGAGTRGVGGIRPRRGLLIRPLLETRRAALRAYLVERGEPWCEDSSNGDRMVPRNAIRHDLLPVLERLAPGGVAALARFAALARDDESALEGAAIEVAGKIVLSDGDAVRLRRLLLTAVPPAVARRVVRRAVEWVSPGAVAAGQIDAIRRLAVADTSIGHLDLPGATVDIAGEDLVVRRAEGGRHQVAGSDRTAAFDLALDTPGAVDLEGAGVRLVAEFTRFDDCAALPDGRGRAAAVQWAAVQGALRVRNRRPGDCLRPLGAPGRRKVQDVFVDRKVPRVERDRVPIVVDESGRIVWVAGYAMAEEFRVTTPESGVVLLKIIDL